MVAIIMLLAVLASSFGLIIALPYVFYQLMNWVVVGGSLTVAWYTHTTKKRLAMWLAVMVAIIFNPIAPLYLTAFAWKIIDVGAIMLLLLSFLVTN